MYNRLSMVSLQLQIALTENEIRLLHRAATATEYKEYIESCSRRHAESMLGVLVLKRTPPEQKHIPRLFVFNIWHLEDYIERVKDFLAKNNAVISTQDYNDLKRLEGEIRELHLKAENAVNKLDAVAKTFDVLPPRQYPPIDG